MPTDTSDLMGKVYDFFSGVYASVSTKQAFLAFEPLGLPMPSASFKDNPADTVLDPALAVYVLSGLANAAATVNGGSLIRAGQKFETFMKLFMLGSMPVDANSAQSLGAAKLDATPAFGQTLPVPGPIPSRFYPAYVTPASWYDPSVNDNWTSHTVGDQQTTQQPGAPPPPPSPPRQIPIDRPVWRVVAPPLRPVLVTPVSPVQQQFHPQMRMMATAYRPLAAAAAASTISASSRPAAVLDHPTMLHLPSQMAVSQLAAVQANSQPQAVATNSISVSFDHCVATLTRPWFPDTLLLLRNWLVPGYVRGEISNGVGAGDTGLMPLLTTAFVAIRNLKISAQWSASDLDAIQGSAGFGPFSLVGRTFDSSTGTLAAPGIQIIGWFCVAFGVLPPASDPALAPPAVSPAPATSTTPSNPPTPDSSATQPTPTSATAAPTPTTPATPTSSTATAVAAPDAPTDSASPAVTTPATSPSSTAAPAVTTPPPPADPPAPTDSTAPATAPPSTP
jgi:hypothetical protein